MADGDHVPEIPFVDVVGKAATLAPAQMVNVLPKLNAGVTISFTVTGNVTTAKHCPGTGVGVNV